MKATCPKCSRRIRIRKTKRDIRCSCGNKLSFNKHFGNPNIYLIDTNIFLFSTNKDVKNGAYCTQVLSLSKNLATTDKVVDELRQYTVADMKVYTVNGISPEVDELHYEKKELSIADKSLIQASIEHPEIAGIITYDNDLKNVCPASIIKSEKKFFIWNAEEYLLKVKK